MEERLKKLLLWLAGKDEVEEVEVDKTELSDEQLNEVSGAADKKVNFTELSISKASKENK